MDRSEHVRQLPVALAVALRLHEASAEDDLIAAALDIDLDEVAPLLDLARAKLDRIARDRPRYPSGDPVRPQPSQHRDLDR